MFRHSLPTSASNHETIERSITRSRQLRSETMFDLCRIIWNAEAMRRPW